MKHITIILALLSLVVCTTGAQPTMSLYQNSMSSGSGGQFTVVISGNDDFQTFCVDTVHEFYPGVIYFYSIGQNEYPGGAPLTAGTAYLYNQFRAGSLLGYDYNNPASAGQLQDVIWGLQGESYGNSLVDFAPGDKFYDDAVAHFGTLANAELPNNPADGVSVITPYLNAAAFSDGTITYYPIPAQSQLIETSVPETGTLLVSSMLLIPIGINLCKRRK